MAFMWSLVVAMIACYLLPSFAVSVRADAGKKATGKESTVLTMTDALEKISRIEICAHPFRQGEIPAAYRSTCDPCFLIRQKNPLAELRYPCDGYLPECSTCRSSFECITNKCWGGKCVYDTMPSKQKCGFKPDCQHCSTYQDCISLYCSSGKCALRGQEDKCGKKGECSACTSSSECVTNKCWGGKCVYDTMTSKLKCGFRPDCQYCSKYTDCISLYCSSHKCVVPGHEHSCLKQEECSHCMSSSQCKSNKCWGGKCVYDTMASKLKCGFKAECHYCSKSTDCISLYCLQNKCINHTAASKKWCGLLTAFDPIEPIEPCRSRHDNLVACH